jgi:pimeloyl-ACP methyl ester carboxylesterase
MLIFIHGMCNIPEAWNPMIEYFKKHNYSSKAIDIRDGLNLKYTHISDYVEKVKSIVTKDDICIGHSLGGLIVQKLAEETSIKAAIAICSAPPKGIKLYMPIGVAVSSIRYLPNIFFNKPFKPSYPFVKKLLLHGLEDENFKNSKKEYEKLGNDSAIVIKELVIRKISVDEKKVTCPFLFIAAEKDLICPPSIVKQMANKYNADFKAYDCCHHFFFNKNWEDIAEGIYQFINSIENP